MYVNVSLIRKVGMHNVMHSNQADATFLRVPWRRPPSFELGLFFLSEANVAPLATADLVTYGECAMRNTAAE